MLLFELLWPNKTFKERKENKKRVSPEKDKNKVIEMFIKL